MEAQQHFGHAQLKCEICQAKLTEFRVLKIRITASSGELLSDLEYEVPLCDKHRGNDSKAVKVEVSWGKELAFLSTIAASS